MTTHNEQPMKLSDFLTLDDLIKMLGIDKGLFHSWRRHEGLPAIRTGKGRWLVHEPTLCAWLKARETSQPGQDEVEGEK